MRLPFSLVFAVHDRLAPLGFSATARLVVTLEPPCPRIVSATLSRSARRGPRPL